MTEKLRRRVAQEFERYRTGRLVNPELDDVPLFIELALDWSPAEFEQGAALLLYLVQAPAARDATLVQWATDLGTGDLTWPTAQGEGSEQTRQYLGGVGPTPDRQRLDRAIAIVERLLAVTLELYAPAPAFMLAWLRWARSSWP
jgi:hypothetical protein